MTIMTTSITKAAREMGLEPAAMERLHNGMKPRAAVQALLDSNLPGAALRLQMRLLPRGYVVPWLCQCAAGSTLPAGDRDGLRLAETWVRERDETNRRAALAHAASHHYVGAGALIAASAGWSEGFLLDASGKEVAPVAAHLMAVVAAAALLTLATDGDDFDARCRAFVTPALGLLRSEGAL
jgi:hypothetical protein